MYTPFMHPINTPTYLRLRDQVRTDIIAGTWPLGSHVTLAQFSSHYQVSANAVREALLQLQGEGVIAMRMNRGAVIPLVDEKYIDNIYQLRGAVQSMLVRNAARLATPEHVNRMMEFSLAFENAAQTGDPAACVAANRDFHQFIDAICDNSLAIDVLQGRSSLVDAFRRSIGYGTGRLEIVVKQHKKIVRAIAAGDEQKAALAAFEHIDSSRTDLLATFKATRS